jgi:hypothetical protein
MEIPVWESVRALSRNIAQAKGFFAWMAKNPGRSDEQALSRIVMIN